MKKSSIGIIVVIVIALAVGGIVLATHKSSTKDMSNMDTTKSSTSDTSSSSSSNTPTATNSVTLDNFAFSPGNITVKKGTAVTWTNKDSTTHTVTETDGKTGPDSGDLANGKTYSFTFDTVGTFKYHCSIHSEMTGTVTVTE